MCLKRADVGGGQAYTHAHNQYFYIYFFRKKKNQFPFCLTMDPFRFDKFLLKSSLLYTLFHFSIDFYFFAIITLCGEMVFAANPANNSQQTYDIDKLLSYTYWIHIFCAAKRVYWNWQLNGLKWEQKLWLANTFICIHTCSSSTQINNNGAQQK